MNSPLALHTRWFFEMGSEPVSGVHPIIFKHSKKQFPIIWCHQTNTRCCRINTYNYFIIIISIADCKCNQASHAGSCHDETAISFKDLPSGDICPQNVKKLFYLSWTVVMMQKYKQYCLQLKDFKKFGWSIIYESQLMHHKSLLYWGAITFSQILH